MASGPLGFLLLVFGPWLLLLLVVAAPFCALGFRSWLVVLLVLAPAGSGIWVPADSKYWFSWHCLVPVSLAPNGAGAGVGVGVGVGEVMNVVVGVGVDVGARTHAHFDHENDVGDDDWL